MLDNYLMHHGVKGQRKGIRRYQNNDATRTLTPEGRIHYGVGPARESKSGQISGANKDKSTEFKQSKSVGKVDLEAQKVNKYDISFDGENGYDTNCTYCGISYDLRRRGYDVKALPLNGDMPNVGSIYRKMYKGFKFDGMFNDVSKEKTNFQTEMTKKYEEGSRGIINVSWAGFDENEAGHVMNWEIEHGSLVIVDSQIGTTYRGKALNELMTYVSDNLYTARLDHLEPNLQRMKESRICE